MQVFTLAFKYVLAVSFLLEVNHHIKCLDNDVLLPLDNDHIREVELHYNGRILGACLAREKYFYGTGDSYHLKFIRHRQYLRAWDDEPAKYNELWSRMETKIAREEIYGYATNMLVKIGVDIDRLNRGCNTTTEQHYYYENGDRLDENKRKIMLPIYSQVWKIKESKKEDTIPTIQIKIFGPTREIIELEQFTDEYSTRPTIYVDRMKELLELPDKEFLKYDDAAKLALVKKYLTNITVLAEPRSGK